MSVVYMKKTFYVFLLLAVTTSPSVTLNSVISAESSPSSAPVVRVSAVIGGKADLPCDSRPPLRNDTLLLVVWYRNDNPVYSFDTRADGPTAHWKDESFSGRAQWLGSPISALQLSDIQGRDRATYRCRVDFQVSPTRNYRVALDVVELPSIPVIFNELGKTVHNVAGPYNEGGEITLLCTVYGGNPAPSIQWLQDDKVISQVGAGEMHLDSETSRSLALEIRNASRNLYYSTFSCVADNTLLTQPRKTTIRIDLLLRPVTVEILSREQPLSVGRMAEVSCRTTGARPPAVVTWWLGGKQLNTIAKQKDVENGNETISMLRLTPLKAHNGQVLRCRAEHPKLNHSAIESKLPLNVYYAPVTTMQLGAKMNPNDIEEGDDVYFECIVDANPPAYKVVWEHNEVQLLHNPGRGMILTGNTNLALRNVSRRQAGRYTCVASNVEGDGRSPPLLLQIVFRPICHKKEPRIVGTALQESSSISCEVEAYPPPDTFEWTLNNSAGSIKIDSERFTVGVKGSVLKYTPVTELDYGTLSCRASNLAGLQTAPCMYNLVPAMRPDPPSNCTVYNLTHDSMDLACVMGYDGGLHCVYVVEVWSHEGLVTNSTNTAAVWSLRRLGAKRQLKIIVYAANGRGRSEHVSFTIETAPKFTPRTEAQEAWEVNWALGGVLGGAVIIVCILCCALIAVKVRSTSRDYEVTISSSKIHKATVAKRNSLQGPDDKNPDLIPLSKGVAECPPEPPPYAAVVLPGGPKSSSSAHSLARNAHTNLTLHNQTPDPQGDAGGRSCGQNGTLRPLREVVTTRTPLLAAHQESCV